MISFHLLGFVTQYLGWRWTNWIAMIWAGCAFVLLCVLKETYSPVLLQRRAKTLRREKDDERYWSRYDIRVGFWELMRINLKRPFVMAATEPICIFWNVYISIIYGALSSFLSLRSCMSAWTDDTSHQASYTCVSLLTLSFLPNIAAGLQAYPAFPS